MRDLQSYIDEEFRKAPEEAMRLYDGKTIEEAFPHVLKSQLESRLVRELRHLPHPRDDRGVVVGEVPAFAGMLGKDRFEIGEQGFDEVRAARVAGGLHLVGDSGTHQAGHGPIQGFAKLNGLEVPGFFVEPRFA